MDLAARDLALGDANAGAYAARMREIEFRIETEELGEDLDEVVGIYVDGIRLQELVRVVELPFAEDEGHPDLAGGYVGLLIGRDLRWPRRHFLGEPVMALKGRTYLLGCVCGFAECWPLVARVTVTDTTVTWSDWMNGYRDWDLSALGDFVFDRGSYEEALVRMTA
jgi:hypothetical protein